MKNVNKSTLILAVIAIAALILAGVMMGEKNKLNDKVAAIGDALKSAGIDVDLNALNGDDLKAAIEEGANGLSQAANDKIGQIGEALKSVGLDLDLSNLNGEDLVNTLKGLIPGGEGNNGANNE